MGNPFDVLKTRLMASEGKSQGLISAASDLYKSQGMKGNIFFDKQVFSYYSI